MEQTSLNKKELLLKLLSEIQTEVGDLAAKGLSHTHEPRHCDMCAWNSHALAFIKRIESAKAEIDWLS